MHNLINVNFLFIALLLFSCKESIENKPLRVINKKEKLFYSSLDSLTYIIESKKISKLYEYADSIAVDVVLDLTDSLRNNNGFGLISERKNGTAIRFISDSTLTLRVGYVDPILAASGGYYRFVLRNNSNKFVLYEIPQLD